MNQAVRDALLAAFTDYVTKLFAVRVTMVNGEPTEAGRARATFDHSLKVATQEYNLALADLGAAMSNDKSERPR